MTIPSPRRVSVSTWALHSLIGTCAAGRPPSANPSGDPDSRLMTPSPGALRVVDVPAALAEQGYATMEICHFHVESQDPAYLRSLREAREASGIELWSLLIDDGDLTHPEYGEADREWVRGWIRSAAALGARRARVIAGKQPATEESLARSIEALRDLAAEADALGVRLMTENWFPTICGPSEARRVFEAIGGQVGLCLDFGNWSGPGKYEDLAAIARYAESCHAKCEFVDGRPNVDDYQECLRLAQSAGFSGPFTLVHGEPGRVWESLDEQRALVSAHL